MGAFAIRPALPSDAPAAGRLLHLSLGPMADFLFPRRASPNVEQALAGLFARPQNRFSYEFADVAEVDGQAVGLLIAYPSALIGRLALPMGWQMAEICGLRAVLRLLPLTLPLLVMREAEANAYYISNLAVLPEFQGQGIGTRLLERAQAKAAEMGLTKCALTVEVGNKQALRLYERLSFRIVRTFEHPWLEHLCGYRGVHRMVASWR